MKSYVNDLHGLSLAKKLGSEFCSDGRSVVTEQQEQLLQCLIGLSLHMQLIQSTLKIENLVHVT